MTRAWKTVMLTFLVVVLGACTGLPADGPVERGLPVNQVERQRVRPLDREEQPVRPGANPEQVVTGFLRANAAAIDDQSIVTSYLTSEASEEWASRPEVLVYASSTAWTVTSDADVVNVEVIPLGALDADGYYRTLPQDQTETLSFGLEQVSGEWRIATLPRGYGRFLTGGDFDNDVSGLYRKVTLYYPSRVDPKLLVPDQRWFQRGDGMATAVARAQMSTVPAYLQGAVTTGFPSGTRLTTSSVPVRAGLATVDVTEQLAASARGQQEMAWAQIAEALGQVDGVERVLLTVAGNDLPHRGASGPIQASSRPLGYALSRGMPTFGIIRRGSTLSTLDMADAELGPLPIPNLRLPESVGPMWKRLAASPDASVLAAVDRDGQRVLVSVGPAVDIFPTTLSNLTRPSVDRARFVWVAGSRGPSGSRQWRVRVLDPDDGKTYDVPSAWLGRRELLAVRVSPDGSRVVVVMREPGGSVMTVGVAGIVRDASMRPRSLNAPLELGVGKVASISDVVWLDERTLAAVGTGPEPEAPDRMFLISIGGHVTSRNLPEATSIAQIAAQPGGGEDRIVLRTSGNRLVTRAGDSWHTTSQVAIDIVAPGS